MEGEDGEGCVGWRVCVGYREGAVAVINIVLLYYHVKILPTTHSLIYRRPTPTSKNAPSHQTTHTQNPARK